MTDAPSRRREFLRTLAATSVAVLLMFFGFVAWEVWKRNLPWWSVFPILARGWWAIALYIGVLVLALSAAEGLDRLDHRVEAARARRRRQREIAADPGYASEEEEIAVLREGLERLAASTPAFKAEVERWNVSARDLERRIEVFRHAPAVPHFLWHYLADADVRYRSAEMAALHAARIEKVLARLREGTMPTDADTEV